MKKLLFFLLLLPISENFTMEERSQELSFPFGSDSSPEDVVELNNISQQYKDKILEIVNGKLSLAKMEWNETVGDPEAEYESRQKYERIFRLTFDANFNPGKVYPSIYTYALDFRNQPINLIKDFNDELATRIKSNYHNSNAHDEDYLVKQQAFQLALDYESNKVYEEIAQKWTAYLASKKINEVLQLLENQSYSFSEPFKETAYYVHTQLISALIHSILEPLTISSELQKIQRIRESLTTAHLNHNDDEAIQSVLALLNQLNDYKAKLDEKIWRRE